MKRNSLILFFTVLLASMAFVSCQNNQPKPFPHVSIEGVADGDTTLYQAQNFWKDYLDPARGAVSDTVMLAGVTYKDVNGALAEYLKLLTKFNFDQVIECNGNFADLLIAYVNKTEDREVAAYLMTKFKRLFYDADSPYRNDEIALKLFNQVLEAQVMDSLSASTMKFAADKICLNRINQKVKDFSYVTTSGKEGSLYEIGGADYTLVIFGAPDCPACTQTLNVCEQSSIAEAVENGRLNLLLMYVDQDIPAWTEYIKDRPKAWIKAFDNQNVLNDLYDLKAVPTLYLLDKDMNLLIKDGAVSYVGGYLLGKGVLKDNR